MTTKETTNTNNPKPPHVYACINAIQAELSKQGIGKDHKAVGGGSYNFRGIDDVYNVLSPIMAKHGLVITPDYSDVDTQVRQSSKGNSLFYTRLKGTFTLTSAVDGSSHTCSTYGEAMDSGDKSTNKAMSIAYKYMCFQVFAIPTQGDNDPDAYVHEELPYQNAVKALPPVDINNIHNVPYPQESVQLVTPDGKPYADMNATLRIFNQEQFTYLVRSVMSGEIPITTFQNPDKYFFSAEQIEVLNKLINYTPKK